MYENVDTLFRSTSISTDTMAKPATTTLLALLFVVLSLTTVVFAGTTAEGLAYLAAKSKEDGVITLPSGLLYKELRPGNPEGKTPTLNSPCECDYAGTLMDGTEFDSSYKRGAPLTFAPNQVIKGWTEAMQLMTEGAKWELYLPSELAYGDNGAGSSIPGGAVLIFTLELLTVKDFVKTEILIEANTTSPPSTYPMTLNTAAVQSTTAFILTITIVTAFFALIG